MKKIIALSCLFYMVSFSPSRGRDFEEFKMFVDHTISYKWDNNINDWVSAAKNVNVFDSLGRVREAISLNINTMDSISRTVYIYSNTGQMTEYYLQNFLDNHWVTTRKYIFSRDETGHTQNLFVTNVKDDILTNSRKQDYFYNEKDKVDYLIYYGWNGSEWYESATEYYFYDETGRFVRTESFYPSGIRINRVFYDSNEYGKRTRMLIQVWSNDDWMDSRQTLYNYDACGYSTYSVGQIYKNGEWINQSKAEYYRSYTKPDYGKFKVPVCHNGHTIYISENALKSHLAHGDCIGECLNENKQDQGKNRRGADNNIKPPFMVYPNPATDRITLKFDSDSGCNNDNKRIELSDFYGKLIKSYNVKGNGDLTIYREGLLSGKYFIRLVGKKVFSTLVIFE